MASHVEPAASSSSRRTALREAEDSPPGSSSARLADRAPDATHISRRPPAPGPDDAPLASLAQQFALVGQSLDQFLIQQFIGGGGMGSVYRAHDKLLDREVAIKVLPRERMADQETYLRFQNEGQSSARLDHPNIARVYHSGEARGLAYIVFEYIDGVNLRDLVAERGPLPVDEAVGITLQVAEALAHASSRNVVHRDIKPSNVIITNAGHVKLVDMGLARVQHEGQLNEDLTSSGVTLGTFDYIAPEQARDPRHADVRSDLYALGCTLYYTLTGQPPFPEGTVLQKLLQHQADAPPDPRALNSAITPDLAAIVGKMMAKDPQLRYQNAPELVADLLLVAEQLGLRGGGGLIWVRPPREAPQWLDRHLPWIAAVAALVVVVLILDYVWSQRAETPVVVQRAALADDISETPQPRGQSTENGAQPSARTAADADEVDGNTSRENNTAQAQTGNESPPSAPVRQGAQPIAERDPAPPIDATAHQGTANGTSTRTGEAPTESGVNSEAPAQNTTPAAEPVTPARQGVWVVDPSGTTPQSHRSFFAAVSRATAGDVIELKYNGRREERPVVLNNLNLTVRAARGYAPVLVFRPDATNATSVTMISVAGGHLTLVDVAIELELNAGTPRGQYAIIGMEAAEGLTLRRSSLTVRDLAWDRNSIERAAMLAISAPAVVSSMPPVGSSAAVEPLAIELENCIVRGEATLLRALDQWPFAFSWNNGLAALSGRLVDVDGAAIPWSGLEKNAIDLRHLTAIATNGVCRFRADGATQHLLPVEVRLSDSLVHIGSTAAMVEHTGTNPLGVMSSPFAWRGQRNVYDLDYFWRTGSAANSPYSGTNKVYGDWLALWKDREFQSRKLAIAWQFAPPPTQPMHLSTTSDYRLDPSDPRSTAVAGASDGRDLGMDVTLLPTLPSETTTDEVTAPAPATSTQKESEDAPPAEPDMTLPDMSLPDMDDFEFDTFGP